MNIINVKTKNKEKSMGSNFANELASGEFVISLEQQVSIHLTSNHYPPVPESMVGPCIAAIEAANSDDFDAAIELPEGVLWRGESSAPAHAIIESHHLDAWIVVDEDY